MAEPQTCYSKREGPYRDSLIPQSSRICWTILDSNCLFVAKFLYGDETPVEYAWSARSKQVRKAWEQVQQASNI